MKISKKGLIGIASSILILLIAGMAVFSFPLFSNDANAFTVNDIFKLVSLTRNYADLTGGEAEFNVTNPTALTLTIPNRAIFDFFLRFASGGNVTNTGIFWKNYTKILVNETDFVSGICTTNETISANGTMGNITTCTASSYIPTDRNYTRWVGEWKGFPIVIVANKSTEIKINASWTGSIYNPKAYDWIPGINISGTWYNQTAWAWWNTSYRLVQTNQMNQTFASLGGDDSAGNPRFTYIWNVSQVLFNSSANAKWGFDTASLITASKLDSACGGLRVVNSTNDTVLNYEIESCNIANTVIYFSPNYPTTNTNATSQQFELFYGDAENTTAEVHGSVWANAPASSGVVKKMNAVYTFGKSGGTSVNDSTVNRYNATIANDATAKINTSGIFGNALFFNGGVSTNTMPIAAWNDIQNNLTISVWYKADQFFGYEEIIAKGTSDFYMRFGTSANAKVCGITTGSLVETGGSLPVSSATELNRWHYYVCTYDGATISLYENGLLLKTAAQTGNVVKTDSNTFRLGKGGDTQFAGLLDEVRIYNWTLSAAEINATYVSTVNYLVGAEEAQATTTVQPFFSSNLTSISNNSAYDTADDWFNVTMGGCSSWCNVSLQINLTANTFRNISMTNNGTGTFYHRFGGGLPAGIFNVTFVANNSDGNSNVSGTWIERVYRSSPVLGLATNTTGLVFYERFNINSTSLGAGQLKMFDSTMNHERARIIAGANTQQWLNTSGYLGSSAFNGGLNNNIRYNTSDVQNSTNITTGITVSAWIKVDGLSPPVAQGCIVTFGNTSFEGDLAIVGNQYCLAIDEDGSNPLVEFYVYNSTNNQIRSGNYILPMNTFVHVAGRFNRTHSALFINGVETNRSTSFLSTTTIQPIAKGGCSAGVCGNDPQIMISEVNRNIFLRVDEVTVVNSSLTDIQINASAKGDFVIDRIVQTMPVLLNTTAFTLVGDTSNAITLFRNDTNIAGGLIPSDNVSLSQGIYNYTAFYPESQNYTRATLTKMLYVEPSQNEAIFYSANVTAPARYSPTEMTRWNVTVENTNGTVFLQSNITGSFVNYTMLNGTINNFYFQAISPASVGYNLTARIFTFSSVGAVSNSSWFVFNHSIAKGIPTIVISNGTQNATVNTTGLVGYWRFEGSGLNDSSGYGNFGNMTGANATAVEGKFGSALSFDGTDDFIQTPNFTLSNDTFTFTAWVYPLETTRARFTIFSSNIANQPQIEIGTTNAFGQIAVIKIGVFLTVSNADTIKNNTWSHIAVVRKDSFQKIFLNGVELSSYNINITDALSDQSSSPKLIGTRGTIQFFNGTIDEVTIWNRTLSADEILMLNGSRAVYGNTTLVLNLPESSYPNNLTSVMYRNQTEVSNSAGLVGYWRFEQSNGSAATNDSSGYGNMGTLTNMNLTGNATSGLTQGQFGNALLFDGKDDYVNLGNPDSLNNLDKFTISAWVTLGDLEWRYSIGKGYWDIGKLSIGHHPSYNGWWMPWDKLTTTWGNNVTNTWTYLTVTGNGSHFGLYENGALKKTQSANRNDFMINNSAAWWIGTSSGDARYWNGSIDEVRIYNRSLTASEITELYNQTRPRGFEYYISNTTGNANYSAQESPVVPLTIDPAVLNGNLYINGTQASQTWTYPNATNATATIGTRINNEGTLFLLRNLTEIGIRNGANFAMNESLLGASIYNFTVAWVGANYTFTNITYDLTILRNVSVVSVSFAPSSPQNYKTSIRAFGNITNGDYSATITLFRNGTQIATGAGNQTESAIIGGGANNYSAMYAQTQNYSASSSVDNNFVINRIAPTLTISWSVNSPQDYKTNIITWGNVSSNNGDETTTTVTTYLNLSQLATGTGNTSSASIRLGGGQNNFSAISTQTQNYSAGSTVDNNFLINRIAPTTAVGFGQTSPQVYTASVLVTGNITVDSGDTTTSTLTLWGNTSQLISGTNNQTVSVVLRGGINNITLVYGQTQNYSANTNANNLFTINLATPVINIYLNGSYATGNNTNLTYPNATIVNGTFVRLLGNFNASLFRNNTLITSMINENLTLAASFWNYTAWWAGDENYTANSTNLNLTTLADTSAPIFSDFGINNTEVDLDLNQSVDISVIISEPSYSLNSTIIQFMYPNRTAYNFTAVRSGTTDDFNVSIVFNFTLASQIGQINFTVYANDSSGNTNSTDFTIRMQTSKINTTAILYSANFTSRASAFVIGSNRQYLDNYFNVSIITNASGTANITKRMNITLLGLLLANGSGTGQYSNFTFANATSATAGYNLINNHINFTIPFNQTQSRINDLSVFVARTFNFSTFSNQNFDLYYFNTSNISNSTNTWLYLSFPLNKSYNPSIATAAIQLCQSTIVWNASYPTCNATWSTVLSLTQSNNGNNAIGSRIFNFFYENSLNSTNMTFNASFSEFLLRMQYVSGGSGDGGGGGGGGGFITTTTLPVLSITGEPLDISKSAVAKAQFYFIAASIIGIVLLNGQKKKKQKQGSSILDMKL